MQPFSSTWVRTASEKLSFLQHLFDIFVNPFDLYLHKILLRAAPTADFFFQSELRKKCLNEKLQFMCLCAGRMLPVKIVQLQKCTGNHFK